MSKNFHPSAVCEIILMKISRFTVVTHYRQSSSCTHVAAVLHALIAITQTKFRLQPALSIDDEDKVLPVTSYACQWKPPRKCKESTMKIKAKCNRARSLGPWSSGPWSSGPRVLGSWVPGPRVPGPVFIVIPPVEGQSVRLAQSLAF